jgi:hypothetical protein
MERLYITKWPVFPEEFHHSSKLAGIRKASQTVVAFCEETRQ